jgi:lipopolysaccharide export system permease protein
MAGQWRLGGWSDVFDLATIPAMIKILDRYLVKGFLKSFVACLSIFCILVILGRFFDKMEIFNNYHARTRDVLAFLALGLPYWLNLVSPVATLLALLFSLGQHQQHGEVTAFRSAGVPTLRLFAPYLFLGATLSALSLWGGLTFLPVINSKARAVYRVNIKKENLSNSKRDRVVVAGQNHRRFTIGWVDVEKNELRDVVVDQFDDQSRLVETFSAQTADYRQGRWVFHQGTDIRYDSEHEGAFRQEAFSQRAVDIPETPHDFLLEEKIPEDMTGRDICERIRRLRTLGVPTNKERVALNLKIALPFAHLIMIALGIPFALQSGHKGRVQTIAYALAVAFLFWGTVSVCQSLGEQGRMLAWLAAWTPNLLFGSLAAVRLRAIG